MSNEWIAAMASTADTPVSVPGSLRIAAAFALALFVGACSDRDEKGPDVSPPSAVRDLRIEPGLVDSAFVLVWTAPGDDGDRGQATRYDIRISTHSSNAAAWFDSVATAVTAPAPASAGRQEHWPIAGLFPDSTYFVRLRSADESGNISDLSNEASSAVLDLVAPTAINDLRIEALTSSRVDLSWSASGDDGSRGRARGFDLRVSDVPIDLGTWDEAIPFPLLPSPGDPGTRHQVRLDGLVATRTYYYAIRTIDDAGLLSPLAPSVRVDTPTIRVVHGNGERTDHPDLRSAIDAAIPRETIELGEGTFTGARNRDLELRGKPLTIRGVGSGEHATILDPEREGRAFSFSFPEESGAFLQDLVLKNGRADVGENFGGAVLCFGGASPTFVRCRFSDNEALSDGGALATRRGSSPRITDCVFERNISGGRGGAIAASDNSRPGLWESRFTGNHAQTWGGAVSLETNSSADVVGCSFLENRAEEYGGAISAQSSHPMIRDCLFEENVAHLGGGAILCYQSSSPILRTSRFLANAANRWGGAVYCWDFSFPEIIDCVLAENVAEQGGAFLCWRNSTARITGCTLAANRADFGTAIRAVGGGSGAYLDRSILAFGLKRDGSNGPGESIRCDTDADTDAIIEATCTLIYGNEGGDWVDCLEGEQDQNGNLESDPLFCDAQSRDYSLRTDSPCVEPSGCERIGAFGAACPPLAAR